LTPERARELIANPERRRLLDQMMDATTREEIDVAVEAQRAWLFANPDDVGVLEAGEDLAYAEEALEAEAGTVRTVRLQTAKSVS
jgi:hypothetical protein